MSDTACITEWGDTGSWAGDRGCMNDLASGRQCGLDPGPNPLPPVQQPDGPGNLPAPWVLIEGPSGMIPQRGQLINVEGHTILTYVSDENLDITGDLTDPSNMGRSFVMTQPGQRRAFTIEEIINPTPETIGFGGAFTDMSGLLVAGVTTTVSIEDPPIVVNTRITQNTPGDLGAGVSDGFAFFGPVGQYAWVDWGQGSAMAVGELTATGNPGEGFNTRSWSWGVAGDYTIGMWLSDTMPAAQPPTPRAAFLNIHVV